MEQTNESKHLKASCNALPRFCSPPFKLCGLRSESDLHFTSQHGQKNRLLPVAAQIIHVIVVPLANALIDEPRKPLKYALFEVASPTTILVELVPRRCASDHLQPSRCTAAQKQKDSRRRRRSATAIAPPYLHFRGFSSRLSRSPFEIDSVRARSLTRRFYKRSEHRRAFV